MDTIKSTQALIQEFRQIDEPSSISPEHVGYLLERVRSEQFTTQALELATDNASKISAFSASKGQASGICPLDASSKVPEQYLPSYVDDVVEFNSFLDSFTTEKDYLDAWPDHNIIVDTTPSEHEALEVNTGGGMFRQDGEIVATSDGAFYFHYSVYSGHSIVNSVLVRNFPGSDRFGERNEEGIVRASAGKIYVCTDESNDCIYRWSGSRLSKIGHTPLVLGTNAGNAYPGNNGKRLESQISEIRQLAGTAGMLSGTLNLAWWFYGQIFSSLQEALENIPVESLEVFGWPAPGVQIRFPMADSSSRGFHWETYRFDIAGDEVWTNPDAFNDKGQFNHLTASLWARVDNVASVTTAPAAGDSSGSSSCNCAADCAANALAIVNLQSSHAGLSSALSSLSSRLDSLESQTTQTQAIANLAKTSAATATNKVANLETQISSIQTEIDNLASSSPTTTPASNSLSFVDINEEGHGIMRGAHSSGLTYNYPTTEFNLLATPSATADALILLPNSLDLDGTIIRILDPRTSLAATARAVRVSTYDSNQQILTITREDPNYWIALRGGYLELLAVRSLNAKGEATGRLDFIPLRQISW